jgi:hypothetical protein
MLRNWVVQFGHAPGIRAGDERLTPAERGKYIDQIGRYFGWNPPPTMSWVVEVTKDLHGKHPGQYIACFMRYVTDDEAEKLLGTRYDEYSHLNPQYEHLAADKINTGCNTGCGVVPTTEPEVVEVVNTNEESSATTEDIFSLLNIK